MVPVKISWSNPSKKARHPTFLSPCHVHLWYLLNSFLYLPPRLQTNNCFLKLKMKSHISPCIPPPHPPPKALFPVESKHSQSVLWAFLCFGFADKVLHCPAAEASVIFSLCQLLALADLRVCMGAPVRQLSSPLPTSDGHTVKLSSQMVSLEVVGTNGGMGGKELWEVRGSGKAFITSLVGGSSNLAGQNVWTSQCRCLSRYGNESWFKICFVHPPLHQVVNRHVFVSLLSLPNWCAFLEISRRQRISKWRRSSFFLALFVLCFGEPPPTWTLMER